MHKCDAVFLVDLIWCYQIIQSIDHAFYNLVALCILGNCILAVLYPLRFHICQQAFCMYPLYVFKRQLGRLILGSEPRNLFLWPLILKVSFDANLLQGCSKSALSSKLNLTIYRE